MSVKDPFDYVGSIERELVSARKMLVRAENNLRTCVARVEGLTRALNNADRVMKTDQHDLFTSPK